MFQNLARLPAREEAKGRQDCSRMSIENIGLSKIKY
jgi:hypothetical protein